jgi:two-component system LytT family response regulator
MTTLRVLFADDELMARRRLRRMLEAMDGIAVVAECESGEAVLAALEHTDVDVALLDVEMGARSGLEVSEAAAELGVEVIFTTAHPEHAVAAFDRGAVDYVLKPADEGRLATAMERARRRIEAARARPPGAAVPMGDAPRPPAARLALEVRGEIVLVDPGEISHALHDGALVTVHAGRSTLLTELSLQELEQRLPPGRFMRVHRRAILNLDRVERLRPQPTGGYLAVTSGGHEVPVSRQAARALRRQLGIG